MSLAGIDSSMVIKEPNSIAASSPIFAAGLLFSLSAIRYVSSIRRVRSSICLLKFSFCFCIASSRIIYSSGCRNGIDSFDFVFS